MIDKLTDLYDKYYDIIIAWYGGLTQIQQIGVLAACFVAAFIIFVLYMLSKITHR
jgi:hypothetical protein